MKLVPTAIGATFARQSLMASKNAPSFLFATGIAGMVGSTVLACRATLKIEEILDDTKTKVKKAQEVRDERRPDYSEEDFRRDAAIYYARAAGSVAKLYAPAFILGTASIGCLTKSHNILTQRNAALTAAYVAVDEAFTQYRRRVVNKYGEQQDREFRHGVQEVEMIDENGKLYTEKRPEDTPSMYARFFDEYSTSWSRQPEYNYVFLSHQQKYANDMLKARGHLFLNEVYDMLGLDRTQAGSVVGWIVSKDGDNYVDFGIFAEKEVDYASMDRNRRDFINGRNNSVLLDFNVDGIIYDKIDGDKERIKWQS